MKRSDFLKLIVFLSVVTITLNVAYLVSSIGLTKGLSDIELRNAMMISVVSTGLIGLAIMIFLFIRINKRVQD